MSIYKIITFSDEQKKFQYVNKNAQKIIEKNYIITNSLAHTHTHKNKQSKSHNIFRKYCIFALS